ncbi:hypothetical protein [Flavobacterium sp. HJJ]|uniref:hypothetical protein n=1 Tax=Flavobacterium sp. HJJ TaxID=2783792 RepID=UPI00188AD296|nr:hypothetical protein [Flavobacterium sp. HJJ]MBF4472888.1 hypothetical protein [Flavobacterium sp. HJJ]
MKLNITQTILVLFIILSSLNVDAKKMDFPLEVVAGSAEIIVIGEIYAVQNNSYTFKIKETLKGKKYNLISVEMFEEWICDTRIEKAVKGQKLCLFLKKKKSSWEIINGSAGELFISGNSIYLGGEDSIILVNHKIARNSIFLDQFKNAISDFCKCYQFIGEFDYFSGKPQYFIQTCSDLQISNFKSKNKFSIWLFEKMERYSIQKMIFIDYNSVIKPLLGFSYAG